MRDSKFGEELTPFISAFCGSLSAYLWDDELGAVHEVHQGEWGEQGDALKPMQFSLGQHPALVTIAAHSCRVQSGSRGRSAPVDLEGALGPCSHHFALEVRKVWNRAGEEPPDCEALLGDPEANL